MTIYKSRPPSNCLGARIAWDVISAPPERRKIAELWYAPEMDDGTWCAQMDDGEYEEMDVLETNWYKWHPVELAEIRARKPIAEAGSPHTKGTT
jgi:hypothetical protein